MAVSKPSERSPLLGQTINAQNVRTNDKYRNGDQGQDSNARHGQPSNARLALIMGSIWVGSGRHHCPDFEADILRLV